MNWSPIYCRTVNLWSCTIIPRNTKHMAIDGQVCFQRQLFADPVKPQKYNKESVEPVNGINKDMRDTTLLPKTISTYPVDWVGSIIYWSHSTAVYVLNEGITCFQLPTHPLPPPISSPSTAHSYYMPFMTLQSLWKKLLII